METKTLEELRALAQARGLRDYDKLARKELLKLLAEKKSAPAKRSRPTAGTAKPRSRATAKTSARPAEPAPAPPTGAPGPGAYAAVQPAALTRPSPPDRVGGEEERIEEAKYAFVPRGEAPPTSTWATGLTENIEYFPGAREPTLCLLPQKPGILHAYWALPAEMPAPLQLRLCRMSGDGFEILQELALPAASGQWYFHVGEDAEPGGYFVHLGYYDERGEFVTAIHHGIARIPSLYASEHTDRLWRVSEDWFRAMYLRAGGFLRAGRLGWTAAIGSPGGAPGARLAWPGGVSSKPK